MDSKCGVKVIIIFMVILFFLWIMFPCNASYSEPFDVTDTEFVDVGQPRYDLKGNLLDRSCILKYYMSPNRQVRLQQYGSEIYSSNYSPVDQGRKDCRKVPCPTYGDGYDSRDTCWTCGSSEPDRMVIPDIHPHVPN
jgi:hypothetical protein